MVSTIRGEGTSIIGYPINDLGGDIIYYSTILGVFSSISISSTISPNTDSGALYPVFPSAQLDNQPKTAFPPKVQ